jgi:hypothetical protein
MPLTEKGQEIMANMKKQYGEEKGKSVFYASKNAGKIKGVDRAIFIRRVSDAARAGKSAKDALSQGLAVREEAKLANGGDFFKQVRQGVRDGKPARQIIADALGVRK